MHNKKGQALVEFIIILPLIIFLIMGLIDYAFIMSNRNSLESKMEDVVTLYREGKTIGEINDYLSKDKISFNVKTETDDVILTLKKQERLITPGLNKVLGNPYYIKVERVLLNE